MGDKSKASLGDPEWRFFPGTAFDLTTTKLRCRGYPVLMEGQEIAFVCLRNGHWYVLRASENDALKAFKTRQAAIDSLFAST